FVRQNDVSSTAYSKERLTCEFVLFANLIHEDPRCIDDYLRADLIAFSCLYVLNNPADEPIVLLDRLQKLHIVQHDRAVIFRSASQRKCHSRIIKLSVAVDDTALQIICLNTRDQTSRFLCIQDACTADRRATREKIVDLEAGAIERQIKPPVGRRDE